MAWNLGLLGAAGAGAAGAYDLLETQILTSAASSVTFTGLGSYSDYKHLQVRWTGRSSSTGTECFLRMNGDSSVSYRAHRLWGSPGNNSVDSGALPNTTSIVLEEMNTSSGNASNVFAAGVFDFLDFANTNKNTTVRAAYGRADINSKVYLASGVYLKTNAVTSLTFLAANNFIAGSRFSLYGMKG